MAEEMQVPFLGQIPLDQRVAQACDEGKSFFELYPASAPALAYLNIVKGPHFKHIILCSQYKITFIWFYRYFRTT